MLRETSHKQAPSSKQILSNAENYLEAAKNHIKIYNFEKAIPLLNKSIFFHDDGWGHIYLGHIYMCLDDYLKAETELNKAIFIMPVDATPLWVMAELYEEIGKINDSEQLYRKALAIAPDSSEVYSRFSYFLLRRGREKEAITCLKWALYFEPEYKVAIEFVSFYQMYL